jgi:predicted metalloprotease
MKTKHKRALFIWFSIRFLVWSFGNVSILFFAVPEIIRRLELDLNQRAIGVVLMLLFLVLTFAIIYFTLSDIDKAEFKDFSIKVIEKNASQK